MFPEARKTGKLEQVRRWMYAPILGMYMREEVEREEGKKNKENKVSRWIREEPKDLKKQGK